MTTYTYTVDSEGTFPNRIVDLPRLTQEVHASAIVTSLHGITVEGGNCLFEFNADLSGGDQAILEAIVLAHTGAPLAVPVQAVSLTGVAQTADGRIEIRHTAAKRTTNFNLRAMSFYSAKAGSIHNVNPVTDTDFGDMTMLLQKWNGTAWVTASEEEATRTVIDFEPAYNYEILGGSVDLPLDLRDATSDEWFLSVIGVPDYPPQYYGQVPFVSEVNLEAVTTHKVVSDGRAISYMAYNAGGNPHTNKLRFILKHPAGVQKRFQLYLEHFK